MTRTQQPHTFREEDPSSRRPRARQICRTLSALALALSVLAPAAMAQDAVTVRGRLVVTHAENFETGQHDVLYRIEDAETPLPGRTQRSFPVDLGADALPEGVTHGARVEIRGTTTPAGALVARANAGGQLTLLQRDVAPAIEDQRTIVLLINFQDLALDPQATPAAVRGIMFDNLDSIDALYRETSGNKVSWSGDVIGPFTVAFDSTSTNYYGWAYDAEAQAQAMGVDLSAYTRRVFVTPPNGTGYGGVANGGGSNTRAWVFRWDNRLAYAHELGPNLTLGHASTETYTYGDRSDFMGNGETLKHVNAAHKIYKGWLPANQIQTVGSGVYTIRALAEPGGGVRALRIPVSGGDDVLVSFRNRARFDNELAGLYANRTSVHTGGRTTMIHAILPDGETYSEDGITVTQLSNDGICATVSVDVVAIARAPELSLSPTQGAAQAGVISTYSARLTNMDSGVSQPTTFDLSVAGQDTSWTYTLNPSSVTLAPGESQSVEVTVEPLAGIPDTSVAVTVYVSGAAPEHSVDATLVHHVDGTPPTAPTRLQASPAPGVVKLIWTASQDARAHLGLSYTIWRDGVSIATTTDPVLGGLPGGTDDPSQPRYTDLGVPAGTYTYEVSCVDAAGNESGRSNAVTVVVGGGAPK